MMTLALAITGARVSNASEYDLIRDLREERGVADSVAINEGAVALARWLVTADMIGRTVGGINFMTARVNEETTIRHLTGETEPSETIANYLAEVSDGAVRPAMFARPAVIPEAVSPAVMGGAADPKPPTDRLPDIIRVSDDMILDRTGGGGLLMRTPGWVVRIDPAVVASLHDGLGRMLGREAA